MTARVRGSSDRNTTSCCHQDAPTTARARASVNLARSLSGIGTTAGSTVTARQRAAGGMPGDGRDCAPVARLHVNGKSYDVATHPSAALLLVLHDEIGCSSVKYGCGSGQPGPAAQPTPSASYRARLSTRAAGCGPEFADTSAASSHSHRRTSRSDPLRGDRHRALIQCGATADNCSSRNTCPPASRLSPNPS
jgi:hypothetical protein